MATRGSGIITFYPVPKYYRIDKPPLVYLVEGDVRAGVDVAHCEGRGAEGDGVVGYVYRVAEFDDALCR